VSDSSAAFPFQSGFNSSSSLGLVRSRNIGPFVADITISERHRDEMVITKHPIEIGSVISDHAYKNPITALLTVGFSNSSSQAQGDSNYVQTVYNNFLTLQQNASPFSVTTGKRTLNNVLIQYINELTNEQTENALILEIFCMQLILVNTSTASTQPAATSSTSSNQSDSLVNGSPTSQGTQQISSADNINTTALYSTTGVPQNF
jgi:hypothetical protein